MDVKTTPLGDLRMGERTALFEWFAQAIEKTAEENEASASVALSGGSTPKAWYQWAHENRRLNPKNLRNVIWATSDERYVSLNDEESNFGNAARYLLQPLGFSEDKCLPWPVDFDPEPGALTFQSQWANRFGENRAFDLCLLGMGDDCHTASLFPGSPLLESDGGNFFSSVQVPEKGIRYTITPSGLQACQNIVVLIAGAGKKEALQAVLEEPIDPKVRPIQVLSTVRDRVTLLCDPEAVPDSWKT